MYGGSHLGVTGGSFGARGFSSFGVTQPPPPPPLPAVGVRTSMHRSGTLHASGALQGS